jgi:dolichol-phosphate mannosyltransferase
MNDCIVIIPTYNEIENIESIIRSVLSQHKPFHILIVDDNSPDHTAERVKLLQAEFEGRLFLENREKKSGLGTAYVHGFRWALNSGYDFIRDGC